MPKSFRRLAAAALLTLTLAGCGGGGGDGGPPTPDPEATPRADIPTATTLLQLCLQSYQMLTDFESGKTFTLPAPYTLQATFSTPERYVGESAAPADTQVPIAFIATSGNAIYVVFRGTKTISEWISDATFAQVDYSYVTNGGKTETGFTEIYATIRSGIIDKVAGLAAGGSYTTLYVTGHSLGGALATVAAPELAAKTPQLRPIVYTFAAPRAGNPVFTLNFNSSVTTSWRVANTNDEAPKVPNVVTTVLGPPPEFKPTLYFYEHVNTEYPITFGGPIHSVADLIFNHSSCNYYSTLCDQTDNPAACKAKGEGLNGCTFK
jgi:triacylglycerol lipase